MKTNFKAWEYRKGFRKDNGKMVYGLIAVFHYTIGFIKYQYRRK